MKIGLFFQEITFTTEFPGSNFLLPTFLTGGKWDFQVANLLLATVNFEPRKCRLLRVFTIAHVVGLCYHAIAHLNYYFCKFKEIFKTAYFCKLLFKKYSVFLFFFFSKCSVLVFAIQVIWFDKGCMCFAIVLFSQNLAVAKFRESQTTAIISHS